MPPIRRTVLALFLAAIPAGEMLSAQARVVTFDKDIAPIIFTRCASCHRPGGGAPFSLLAYDDVRRRAALITKVTESRYMPPWKPEPGFGDFEGERRLSDPQIALIAGWVAGGTPEGDASDLPATPQWPGDWQLGKPDLIVTMPEPYQLRADGPDVFRTFVIPLPVAGRRYVRGLEFRPGTAPAVHHANIKIDATRSTRRLDEEEPGPGFDGGSGAEARFPDGHFLGWTPGQVPGMSPADMAWRLDPDSDLVVELHMMPTGKQEAVQVSVGLFFTDQPPSRIPYMVRLGRQNIDIPPGEHEYVETDSYVLPVDVDVLSVQPHAHYLAKEVIGTARLPDGTIKPLIFVPTWDFKWQDVYRYREPLQLPRGTTLTMRYTYDNSAANLHNPNQPPKRVAFGQTTSSEMDNLWIQVVPRRSEDLAVLERDYAPKMLQADIAGYEKTLEITPRDGQLHADLAFRYLAAGRIADAIGQLNEAVRLEPDSASSQYALGTVLLSQSRFDDARPHFDAAVLLKPDFSEAYSNLGVVSHAQGKLDEAIASYRKALDVESDNYQARYNLGRALASQGKPEEAVVEYRRILQMRPDDPDTLSSLASVLTSTGRIKEAVERYHRALELSPDLEVALADLAWILATSDQTEIRAPKEAVGLAEHAANLTRFENATVLDTLAMAYFSAGRTAEAITTAEAALNLASRTGAVSLAQAIQKRLDSYKQRIQ